jgi:aspartate aminotransferase
LYAGFSTSCQYRYWDPVKRGIDFEGMIEDLRQAPENAVVVLQMCAHNPTGCDLTKEQWTEVAAVMQVGLLSHVRANLTFTVPYTKDPT